MKIEQGDRIKIDNNLESIMLKRGFDSITSREFQRIYAGRERVALQVWNDPDTNSRYVTIDLCVEIPEICCKKIENG